MCNLRWLIKTVPTRVEVSPGSYGGQMMDSIMTIRVLQEKIPSTYVDTPDEWINVPEVREEDL